MHLILLASNPLLIYQYVESCIKESQRDSLPYLLPLVPV